MRSIKQFNNEWEELVELIPYQKLNKNECEILKRRFEKDHIDIIKNNDELTEISILELINKLDQKLDEGLETAYENYKKNADKEFFNNLKLKITKFWKKIN